MNVKSIIDWNDKRRLVIALPCWPDGRGDLVTHAAQDPLIMGIFPCNKATENTTIISPLANYLSERLGRVILVTSGDFDSF
jgi:ABC-type phosphate/phosphonate transport system substrate-binding protein